MPNGELPCVWMLCFLSLEYDARGLKGNTILEEIGYRIGRQLKQLGVHMNYAPVLDINTNPLNPIIGNRSFGEDPQRVTAKGIAMMRGMQGRYFNYRNISLAMVTPHKILTKPFRQLLLIAIV